MFEQLINTIVNTHHQSWRKGVSAVKRAQLYRYTQKLRATGKALAMALWADHTVPPKKGNLLAQSQQDAEAWA